MIHPDGEVKVSKASQTFCGLAQKGLHMDARFAGGVLIIPFELNAQEGFP
jgi:hypothetical protein